LPPRGVLEDAPLAVSRLPGAWRATIGIAGRLMKRQLLVLATPHASHAESASRDSAPAHTGSMKREMEYGASDPGVLVAARDFSGESGDVAPHRATFEDCHRIAGDVALGLGFDWVRMWRQGRCSTCGDLTFPVYSGPARFECASHVPRGIRVGADGDPLEWMRSELEGRGVVIMSAGEYFDQAPAPFAHLFADRGLSLDQVALDAGVAPELLVGLAGHQLEGLSALDLVCIASALQVELAELVDVQLVEARVRLSAEDGIAL